LKFDIHVKNKTENSNLKSQIFKYYCINFRKVGVSILAFFIYSNSIAQQYSLKNFSVAEGLPQSQVFGLYEDDGGYIWMGTKGGGIVRFDGKKFEPFLTEPKLLFVSKITAKSSNVYIAHNTGFSIYDLKTRKTIHPVNAVNLANEPVSLILTITKDSILVGTVKHIYIGTWSNLKKVNYPIRDADDVVSCGILFNNAIYVGNNYGVIEIKSVNNSIETKLYARKNGLKTTAIRCFTQFNNKLLVGTYGGGNYIFENNKFISVKFPKLSGEEIVQCFNYDSHDNLWIGTANNGVFIYNTQTKKTDHITESEGLCRNNIVSLLEDSWGNMWIGSSGGGISRYNGQLFINYTNKTGLEGKNVYSCLQTPDSTLWLGTSAPGITAIQNGQITQFNRKNGFTDSKIKSIHYSSFHDLLLLGTEGDGIWTFNNNTFTQADNINIHCGKWIKNIVETKDHRLFISTASRGLIVLDNNLEYSFTLDKTNHLPNNRLNATLVDDEKIWVATEGSGLIYYDEKTHIAKNLSSGQGFPGTTIRSIVKDDLNRIWIGSPSGAGYFNKDLKLTKIIFPEGFNNIYFCINHESSLYFGTAKGIVKFNYSLSDDKTEQNKISVFSSNEGFSGIECSQNAVAKGINNTLLFGTINGLSVFQPSFEQINNLAPKLSFKLINLFYENLLSNENALNDVEFSYLQNHLGFKFNGINQLNPDGVKYQWKLNGLEKNWSPLTTNNEVNYTNLNPGKYTFLVRACNENGVWTETPLKFRFVITNPWFRQTWFYISIVLIGLFVLILIYFILTYRNRKKQERVSNQLRLENQLLEIQQMALRLQMNPHFIFNCLNSIQNLVSQNRNEDANFYIQKFSGLMRGMVDLTPRETIRLDEELKLLTNYLELEKLNRSNSFDYEIKIELLDQPDFYRIPPLLLQPFAENAIVHGFKGINYTGKILIRVYDENNKLKIDISDNGIGMLTNELELPAERNSAIKITTQRLDLYNHKKGEWLTIQKSKDKKGLVVTLALLN
jgi:ligand-binding sensor domain-containing protein